MDGDERTRTWRIGELAAMAHRRCARCATTAQSACSLPLAHRGRPSAYTSADVSRLYRILALRSLGLPLAEIGRLLDERVALADVLARQLDAVERRMADDGALRTRLRALIETCTAAAGPTVAQLRTRWRRWLCRSGTTP